MGPEDDKIEIDPNRAWQLSFERCGVVREFTPAVQPPQPYEYTQFEFSINPNNNTTQISFTLPDGVSGESIIEDLINRNSRNQRMWSTCDFLSDPIMRETSGERNFSFAIYYEASKLSREELSELMNKIDRELTKFSIVVLGFILYANSIDFHHIGRRSIEDIFLKKFKIQTATDLLTCFNGILVRIPWIADRNDPRIVPAGSLMKSQLDKK